MTTPKPYADSRYCGGDGTTPKRSGGDDLRSRKSGHDALQLTRRQVDPSQIENCELLQIAQTLGDLGEWVVDQ